MSEIGDIDVRLEGDVKPEDLAICQAVELPIPHAPTAPDHLELPVAAAPNCQIAKTILKRRIV